MLDRLRQIVLGLALQGDQAASRRDARRLMAAGARAARAGTLSADLDALAAVQARLAQETDGWLEAEQVAAGQAGPFDACDLRPWLAVAARAGIPAVPARPILSLAPEEADAVSGRIPSPPPSHARDAIAQALADARTGAQEAPLAPTLDLEALEERLFAAMDDVPEGWMVRHARAGAGSLKALAGCGALDARVPEVRFGPTLEIGPGWVRVGNRRRVDTADRRIVSATAEGPDGRPSVFLARPWVPARRWHAGDDPHRHGSPFAGKGSWPCEWRAFVEGGQVVGVSAYYAWACPGTPEDARQALAVRDLAQRLADQCAAQGLLPRFAPLEIGRDRAARDPALAEALADFPREGIACTLDFLEGPDGLVLLEGGPAHSPLGGGHPCGFAGQGGAPLLGRRTTTRGVALGLAPGVHLAEPATWAQAGDGGGAWLSFEEAARRAAEA